jgi:hypothetical protein
LGAFTTHGQRLKILNDKVDVANLEISEIMELCEEEKITHEEMGFLWLR